MIVAILEPRLCRPYNEFETSQFLTIDRMIESTQREIYLV